MCGCDWAILATNCGPFIPGMTTSDRTRFTGSSCPLHGHAVLHLEDLHAGVPSDKVGENALVVRGQVLHQGECHARIGVGVHAREEGFERSQPACRRTDANDGEAGLGRGT